MSNVMCEIQLAWQHCPNMASLSDYQDNFLDTERLPGHKVASCFAALYLINGPSGDR